MLKAPFVSVIIPVHTSRGQLKVCLDALTASSFKAYEIIVVDDASSDDSAEIARRKGAFAFSLPHQSGPAAARNFGAQQARGKILLFLDSDVVVKPDTLKRVVEDFEKNPGIAAVFGSYDDDPAEHDFFSQYKNLQHHFVHQQSNTEAVTFWAGCGAIRREDFCQIGGFDQERYCEPAIEDIELGLRLKKMGYRIILDKALQVKHLKRWSFLSLLRTDIFARAIPWSKYMLESQQLVKDLNLQTSDRISAGLVALFVMLLPFSVLEPSLLFLLASLLLIIVALNYKLYRFFFQKNGIIFALLAFPLHCLYYFYSGVSFATCWCMYVLARKR